MNRNKTQKANSQKRATPVAIRRWSRSVADRDWLTDRYADDLHDFVKSVHDVWYEADKATWRLIKSYMRNPRQTLAELASNPAKFGRLAHPITLVKSRMLARAIKTDLIELTRHEAALRSTNREFAKLVREFPKIAEQAGQHARPVKERDDWFSHAMKELTLTEQVRESTSVDRAEPRPDTRDRSRTR